MKQDIMRASDGAELPVDLVTQQCAQIEEDAQQVLLALTATAASRLSAAPEAEKWRERLAFAVARLDELKRAAAADAGAFAPARAEVAASILESQVALAAGFINRTMRSVRRTAGRRQTRASIDEAVTLVEEQAAEDETKAA
jgi:hypothetical protein